MTVAKRREKFTGVITQRGKLRVRGKRQPFAWGRTSFKLFVKIAIAMQYKPTHPIRKRLLKEVRQWVAWNQRLFSRADVWLRVFYETGGWFQIAEGEGMFGSPPWDPDIVGIDRYLDIADNVRSGGRDRVKRLTPLGVKSLRFLFNLSHKTGCCFELVCDATLKHTAGLSTPVVDHHIRQIAFECRKLQQKFPNAAVMISARNEWDAHNGTRTSLSEVNAWAGRFYRWKKGPQDRIAFLRPGIGWIPEQWPESTIIVDHGGRNDIEYRCGTKPGMFQMAAVHLTRGKGWEKIPLKKTVITKLKRQANGAPLGITESMYLLDKEDRERGEQWYRVNGTTPDGWTTNLNKAIEFYSSWPVHFAYGVVHDEKGVQCDVNWPRPITRLEDWMLNFFA